MANNSTNIPKIASQVSDSSLGDGDMGVLMTSCVVGVIANFFVTYLILTVRRLKTVTNVFVFSICLCNVLVSAVLLPMRVSMDVHDPLKSIGYSFINLITILIYICNLTAVSYDRLLSITQPMLYQLKQTRRRSIIIVVFMWIIPTLYGLLPLFWIFIMIKSTKPGMHHIIHRAYLTTTLVVFLLGPLFFIIYVYFRVCLEMNKMSTLKKKLMAPIKNKLHLMRNDEPVNDAKPDASTENSQLTNFNDIDIYTKGNDKPVARRVTDISMIEEENLGMLEENESTECFGSTYDRNNKPCTPESRKSPNEKVSIVTFNGTPNSFDTEGSRLNDCSPSTMPKGTCVRNSIFSHVRTSLSPLNRKRASSISRMKYKAQELKASFAFLISAITYMFTWLPVVALNFDVVLQRNALPDSLTTISLYAIAFNALSDPFLYGLLLPNFRNTLQIMLRRLKRDW